MKNVPTKKYDFSEKIDFKTHPFSSAYNVFIILIVLTSIFLFVFDSVSASRKLLISFESIFLVIMTFDLYVWLKFYTSKAKKGNFDRTFFDHFFILVQIIVIVSSILDIFTLAGYIEIKYTAPISILQCLRLLVILRFLRFFSLVLVVISNNVKLFRSWFLMIFTGIFVFAAIFYTSEHIIYHRPINGPDGLTIWKSIYYAFIVVTTIGLGDISANHSDVISQIATIFFGFVGGLQYTLLGSLFVSGILNEWKKDNNFDISKNNIETFEKKPNEK